MPMPHGSFPDFACRAVGFALTDPGNMRRTGAGPCGPAEPGVRPVKIATFLVLTGHLLLDCGSPPTRQAPGPAWLQVDARGMSLDEADREARLQMVEQALGTLVESRSAALDGQAQYRFLSSGTQGFVKQYRRLSSKRERDYFVIQAKGQVSTQSLGAALEQRQRDIGNPRMMILMSEQMLGQRTPAGETKSEYEFQAQMKKAGFDFIDREQFQRMLANEKGLQVGAYGNPSAEEKALKAAAQLNAEILAIGQNKTVNGGEVRKGTGIYSIQTDLRFKLINVGSARILGTKNVTAIASDVNADLGATAAIAKATSKLVPELKEQITREWKAGSSTMLTFKGIEIGPFIASGIAEAVRSLRGVNGANDRGDRGAGPTLEVTCFCSSFELVKLISRQPWLFSQKLVVEDVKGNRATFRVAK